MLTAKARICASRVSGHSDHAARRLDGGTWRGTARLTVSTGHVRRGVRAVVVEVADDLIGMGGSPVVQGGAGERMGNVDPVIVELCRSGEHADRADDGVPDRHHGDDDGQSSGNPGQIEGQTGPAGDHQVAEHPLGEVDRTGRAADHGRHDEPEDVHEPRHQGGEDAVAAGWAVGPGGHRVGDEAHAEKDRPGCRC